MLLSNKGDRALLSISGLPDPSVTNLGSKNIAPRYIGPFRVVKILLDANTLDILTTMRIHPTLNVGRLKAYLPEDLPSSLPRSSVPPQIPTPLDDDADDDWYQVLPERVQTRSAWAFKSCSLKLSKTLNQPLLLLLSPLGSFHCRIPTILSTLGHLTSIHQANLRLLSLSTNIPQLVVRRYRCPIT